MPGANYVGGRPKDESKLSKNPRQIRNRLRRAARHDTRKGEQIKRDMELLYQKPLAEWDMEELARGRPRNSKGTFQGRVPSWVTPGIIQEAKRRLISETMGQMAGHIGPAVQAIEKLITSEEVDDNGKPIVDARTRLAAATFIIEHFIGKPKEFVTVTTDETKTAIAAAIVLDDGQDQSHFVIEGDFDLVEDEEEDGEDNAES